MGKLNTSSWVGISALDDRTGQEPHCWTPAVDVLEMPDGFVVEVELPGMTLDDVKVELKDNQLLIFGQRTRLCRTGRIAHHVMERACGPFARKIVLPRRVDEHGISATLKHGLLVLMLNKAGSARRTIPVG